MEIGAYLRPLLRWWWLLLIATLLAAAASYWHVRQQPPLYETKTTLMIGRVSTDPNPTGGELSLGQELAATYADLAARQAVRDKTMAALGVTALPDYTARALPNRLVVEISVVDTDPHRAQAVANELANQLILQSPTAPKPQDQQREAFINGQLASLQDNITRTEAEITAKQAELEKAIGALEINDLQGQVTALQTKLSTLQSNYAALLSNTNAGATNTLQIIEPADLPAVPTDSGELETILAAAGIAFVLAAGTAYLLDYLDDTVRTTEDVVRVSHFANLPSIPKFAGRGRKTQVIAQETPHSPVTDAFRALRTGLFAATTNKPGKTLLITSATPKEGKSVIAANLATVLAQGGKSVLLIDADLRRPMLHKLYGIAETNGLAELLMANQGNVQPISSGELIQGVIQKAGPMRPDLIVAGSHLTDASDLLGSDTMKALLETAAQDVDYVIIDSPPLLAVVDALILSTIVDGVILVARAGSIHRKQLGKALHRLADVNANVIGVVLNRQKFGADGYYKY